MKTLRLSLVALGLLATAPASGVACPPPAGDLGFGLLEDGDPVGRLGVKIRERETGITILTVIDIRVTALFVIPVLVYRHSSEEVWSDGAFRRFSGFTVDNGREFAVTVSAQGEGLRIEVNGASAQAAGALLSWLLWCEDALMDGPLVNPLKGRRSKITVSYAGLEPVAGRDKPARRYDVTRAGRTSRVWYGPDGIAVRADIPTKRGSLVTVVRE
jgi:hypothetical protein